MHGRISIYLRRVKLIVEEEVCLVIEVIKTIVVERNLTILCLLKVSVKIHFPQISIHRQFLGRILPQHLASALSYVCKNMCVRLFIMKHWVRPVVW